MISIDTLTSTWNALSPEAQLAQWETFIVDLDGGCGGFHAYYRVLMPLWDQGDVPDAISDAAMAALEQDMRADWQWRLENPDVDAASSPAVFRDGDVDFGEPPY